MGAKAGDKVFLYDEDSVDGQEIVGIEGDLLAAAGKLIARPAKQEYYHGPRFW